MQIPVTKRSAITPGDVGGKARIRPLAAAPIRAETMNRRRGSNRSAIPKPALTMVPTTNPSCTALVNKDAVAASSPALRRRSGTTAEAENHSAMASTWATIMMVMEARRPSTA